MKGLLSLALLATLGTAAFAQSLIQTGELTTSDPRFNRPSSLTGLSGAGTAVAYDSYSFVVSAVGNYTAELSSPGLLDGYLLIYTGTFNPAAPLANLLNGDDDYTGAFTVLSGSSATAGRGSRIAIGEASNFAAGGLTLSPGTTYTAVATAFGNATGASGIGAYTLGIGGGPGNVSFANPVPEPATMAALGLGALALLKRRRKA